MKSQEHFGRTAQYYDEKRSKGILGRIVRKEEKIILKYLHIQEGEKILDAGSGAGYYSIIIKERGGKPYGVDISKEMINRLVGRGLDGEVGDLERLKLGMKFDKILCAGALEFLKKPEQALENFHKQLKKGGELIILHPRTSIGGYGYRLYHITFNKIRIHLFAKTGIRRLLQNAGFKIIAQVAAGPNCAVIKAKKQ